MPEDDKLYTQADLEHAKAMATVQATLAVIREDLTSHEADDEKNFGNIHKAIRSVAEDVVEIPKTVYKCRDQLEADIEKGYVSQNQFNKLTYTLGGIVLVGMFMTWAISLYVNVQKLAGG
jgi:hypothetical protein